MFRVPGVAIRRPVLVLGTRPEVIKLAPVYREMLRRGMRPWLLNTGQQRELARQACEAFGLVVDADLDLMLPDQSPADLLGRCLPVLEQHIRKVPCDAIVVQGDTTSALAGALAGYYRGIPVAHVEAGLRTHNLRSPFPEEGHRQMIGRLAHWNFCPTNDDADALAREGIVANSIQVVGNTVIDAILHQVGASNGASAGFHAEVASGVVITTHRRENLDNRLDLIIDGVRDLALKHPGCKFTMPLHPNPRVAPVVRARLAGLPNVNLCEPLAYDRFVSVLASCRLVITDSGGLQEEAPALGKPVVVVRDTTERPLGVRAGCAFLVGSEREAIVRVSSELLRDGDLYRHASQPRNLYGDGLASQRIASILLGEQFEPFVSDLRAPAAATEAIGGTP